jgi:hypothetical protein
MVTLPEALYHQEQPIIVLAGSMFSVRQSKFHVLPGPYALKRSQ